MGISESLYTDAEVGKKFNTSPRQIRDLRYRGELGYVRVGRLPRIRESDLSEYLNRRAVAPTRARIR